MPDVHAVLSASGSKRWLSCPPSARLEQKFPEKEEKDFAAEGTYAHSMAEYILTRFIKGEPENLSLFDNESPFYSAEMVDYVREYTDACEEKIMQARATDEGSIAMVEQRLDFSEFVPHGFGTGDCVIISDGLLEIVDLKYGKGVKVEAEGNTQLQLYALGAISAFSPVYDFDKVRMTIVQPRNGGISEQTKTVEELLAWGESVKPIAKLAIEGKGAFKAGEHCRFCRAAPRCKALADYNMELAKLEFKDIDLLTDEEVADVLSRVDDLKHYADMIARYALQEALSGQKKWPGYKLVAGRSRRVYKDAGAAGKVLLAAGYSEDKIYKKELLGITDMTKLLTRKKFDELLGDYIEKPMGKPTLVPSSDKRPEYNPAAKDFTDLDKENEK